MATRDPLWTIRRSPDGRHAMRTDRHVYGAEAWTLLDAQGTCLRAVDVEGWEPLEVTLQQLLAGAVPDTGHPAAGALHGRAWCAVCGLELSADQAQEGVCGEYHRGVRDAEAGADVGRRLASASPSGDTDA